MVLYSFHYVTVAFFLSVWTRSLSWTMLIYFLVQMSLVLAGFSVVPASDTALFWGWQTLAAFLGFLAGFFVGPRPILKTGDLYAWLYLIGSLAAWVAAELLYAYFPPLPSVPAGRAGLGLALTFVGHVVIIFFIWYGMSREHGRLRNRVFWRWMAFTALLELLFFIALAGFAEIWIALIAGGSVTVLALATLWFWPFRSRRGNPKVRSGSSSSSSSYRYLLPF